MSQMFANILKEEIIIVKDNIIARKKGQLKVQ